MPHVASRTVWRWKTIVRMKTVFPSSAPEPLPHVPLSFDFVDFSAVSIAVSWLERRCSDFSSGALSGTPFVSVRPQKKTPSAEHTLTLGESLLLGEKYFNEVDRLQNGAWSAERMSLRPKHDRSFFPPLSSSLSRPCLVFVVVQSQGSTHVSVRNTTIQYPPDMYKRLPIR